MKKNVFVTGGMGFIGSSLIKKLYQTKKYNILNIDKLTYASNKETLKDLKRNYDHIKLDICDKKKN